MTSAEAGRLGLTGDTDFAAFARENLAGGGGLGSLRSDCFPVDAVLRLRAELAGSPLAARLDDGVAACLADPDPFVRAQAAVFCGAYPPPPRNEDRPG
jgi:hypothetical protein